MEHCAPWVLRYLRFQLMHHFCYRQQERPCFPSAQTLLATWITWILNQILCFQKTNYWKPFFLLLFFFPFFTCHSISHEIKTVIWITEKYTLLSYYNNDFTPSKKKNSCTTTFQTSSFLHQRWQTMIVQIPNFIHLSRKKSFKLISCRLHSPDFLHSLFS